MVLRLMRGRQTKSISCSFVWFVDRLRSAKKDTRIRELQKAAQIDSIRVKLPESLILDFPNWHNRRSRLRPNHDSHCARRQSLVVNGDGLEPARVQSSPERMRRGVIYRRPVFHVCW